MTSHVSTREMRVRIEQNLLKSLFFRPDLITTIKAFLIHIISIENIPHFCKKRVFFKYLTKNNIKIENNEEKKETEHDEAEEEMHFKQIIEKDDLELLQQEFENNKNIILNDSFFEEDEMKIPILPYCIMKKATKCFKFLILNGADPFQTLSHKLSWEHEYEYEWDCISIAVCFGEWEMMKILEERGIDKLNNPNVWQAAALSHRNKLLKLLISKQEEISNFKECLNKGLLGATKGNNLKEVILLISKGEDINTKNIIYQITKNHF